MSFSPIKREILDILLLQDKPATPAQIAKEAGKELRVVNMHLLGLKRIGYAALPAKGYYIITAKGKQALGIPEITKEKAKTILSRLSQERAFHFYAGIGKPLDCYAYNPQDFCDKICKISLESVDFHIDHGDFEAWFRGLGDLELARKVALLKERKIRGNELRRRLSELVANRCTTLLAVAESTILSK